MICNHKARVCFTAKLRQPKQQVRTGLVTGEVRLEGLSCCGATKAWASSANTETKPLFQQRSSVTVKMKKQEMERWHAVSICPAVK